MHILRTILLLCRLLCSWSRDFFLLILLFHFSELFLIHWEFFVIFKEAFQVLWDLIFFLWSVIFLAALPLLFEPICVDFFVFGLFCILWFGIEFSLDFFFFFKHIFCLLWLRLFLLRVYFFLGPIDFDFFWLLSFIVSLSDWI